MKTYYGYMEYEGICLRGYMCDEVYDTLENAIDKARETLNENLNPEDCMAGEEIEIWICTCNLNGYVKKHLATLKLEIFD